MYVQDNTYYSHMHSALLSKAPHRTMMLLKLNIPEATQTAEKINQKPLLWAAAIRIIFKE